MTPTPRTPEQRDQRFTRVRRLTGAILVGSAVTSGLGVAYLGASTKPVTTTVPTTTICTSTASGQVSCD